MKLADKTTRDTHNSRFRFFFGGGLVTGNVGYIVTLQPVFLEPTRAYLKQTGILNEKFRRWAQHTHPDTTGNSNLKDSLEEEMKIMNAAKRVMDNPDYFAEWQKGKELKYF